jgi:hypothetical protein
MAVQSLPLRDASTSPNPLHQHALPDTIINLIKEEGMSVLDTSELEAFIVRAKAHTYVGGGQKSLAYRPFSHDLQFHEGSFSYLDSYFGGNDFIGQKE